MCLCFCVVKWEMESLGEQRDGVQCGALMGCGGERCDVARSGDSVMGRDGCEEAVVSWHLITCGHQSKRVCVS